MIDIEMTPIETVHIGGAWKQTFNLVPSSGSLTINSVSQALYAQDSTTDVSSSYVTGSPSIAGSQITSGQVGTGGIPAGRYTYWLIVTTSANVYMLFQNFEFLTLQGL